MQTSKFFSIFSDESTNDNDKNKNDDSSDDGGDGMSMISDIIKYMN